MNGISRRSVFLMIVLCATIWFVTRNDSPKVTHDVNKHMSSHGHVLSKTVSKLLTRDIQCVGAGPDEAEDLFCMERPNYLPNFKNPCWYAKENGKFRLKCVPYYHVLGVSKSGTTDISYRIRAHEDVLNCNDCQHEKEIFYWCRRRYGYTPGMTKGTPCNFSCFQQKFTTAAQEIEQTATETGVPPNDYRLYSEYMMKKGQSVEDFHAAVSNDIQIEEACMKNHTVEQCLYSLDIARKLRLRVFLGCYSVYMRQWLKLFPRDQFLILRTEDQDEDPKARLSTIYNYLKLNYTEEWLASITRVPHKNTSKKKKTMGPMLQKTRVLLDGFYSRYNQDLADMLQDKMFPWLA